MKFLPDFGWYPVVLTSSLPYRLPGRYDLVETLPYEDTFTKWKRRLKVDHKRGFKAQIGLTEDIDSQFSKVGIRVVELCKGLLAYPDAFRNWYAPALERATKLIRERQVDAILSSSSPVTTHLVASTLKRKHNLPWAADLRDLWTQNHYYRYGRLRKTLEKRMEVGTLKRADALITVSEPLAKTLKRLHKNNRTYVVTNGFDPNDYESVPLTRDFTITYTGQIYEGKQDPRLFLTVARELIDNGLIDEARVRIRFFGPKAPWLENFVKHLRIEKAVSFDCVDRATALRKQVESQLLLLLNSNDSEDRGVYTGKLFEYLGARRPIISIGGAGGVVKELLVRTNAGVFCGAEPDSMRSAIIDYYREYFRTGVIAYRGNTAEIDKYSHREMAKRFADVLSGIDRKPI